MARVTLGELKNAARNRLLRRVQGSGVSTFPTPMPIASSAVRRYHREGEASAMAYLNNAFDQSHHWGADGSPQARGWARSIRSSFQSYIDFASQDSRTAFASPISADVRIGQHTIGVSLDVVLLDARGYVGRYVLWDTPPLTRRDAELLAAPLVLLVQQELGRERAAGMEIWQLRTRQQEYVDSVAALGRLSEVVSVISAYAS